MPGKQRHIDQSALGAMIEDETSYPIWCDHCGTDSFIFIEAARRRHWAPAHYLDVTYFCSECDAIYGHLVNESEIKPEFMAALTRTGHPQASVGDASYYEAS